MTADRKNYRHQIFICHMTGINKNVYEILIGPIFHKEICRTLSIGCVHMLSHREFEYLCLQAEYLFFDDWNSLLLSIFSVIPEYVNSWAFAWCILACRILCAFPNRSHAKLLSKISSLISVNPDGNILG